MTTPRISIDPAAEFRRAMAEAGLSTSAAIIADGKLHRFRVEGDKPGTRSGWFVFFSDEPAAGAFGCWKRGITSSWCEREKREMDAADLATFRRRMSEAQAAREAEERRAHEKAAVEARRIWDAAGPADPEHPYLQRKQIRPHGLRQAGEALLVPMYGPEGVLRGLQRIFPDGTKRFLKGTAKRGSYWLLGEPNGTAAIVEGPATGITVHEAAGLPVVVAFDAGNLEPVAREIRAQFPAMRLLLAGDNDRKTEGKNVGAEAAAAAATAVGGLSVLPHFTVGEEGSDWNDFAISHGPDAVATAIRAALSNPLRLDSPATSFASFASFAPLGNKEPGTRWPAPMAAEAFQGLAGDVVRAIEPHSEADPVALLVTFLVGFGNLVGTGPHLRVEGDTHGTRVNAIITGDTSKGRKGTSWGRIRRLLGLVDSEFIKGRTVEGLASGEGLIWAVHDPVMKGDEAVDPGVSDKRLLVTEGEFGRVLKVMAREGNTLSAIIRSAWDTGDLATLTKGNPAKATGAHISILGHITRQELLRDLSATESANGFGNRFLWVMSRRSKCLPLGGDLRDQDLIPLAERLRSAAGFARRAGEISWAPEARPLWERVYPELSDGRAGMVGALVSRAESQATRLACLYAVLDQSREILPQHLAAALAVWDYAEASVRFIFGTLTGDTLADEIHAHLLEAPEGLARTEISDLFKRHKSKDEINVALATLERLNIARSVKQPSGGGRPREVWHATERERSERSEQSPRQVA